MSAHPLGIREPSKITSAPGSAWGIPGVNYLAVATIGYEDEQSDAWISIRSGQLLVEVTYRTGNSGQRGRCRVAAGLRFDDLEVGEQVLVGYVGGSDVHGVIICSLNHVTWPVPVSVAGLQTGGATANELYAEGPGPAFTFMRTRAGRPLAFESGQLADLLLHSGASVEIKGAAIHLAGIVHLGSGFASPPVPPTIAQQQAPDTGAGEGVLPGAIGGVHVPPVGGNPTTPPYVGAATGLVRAKDRYQSNAAVDPPFWAYFLALDTLVNALSTFVLAIASLNPATIAAAKVVYDLAKVAFNLVPKPQDQTSAAMTASMCTAGDALPAP